MTVQEKLKILETRFDEWHLDWTTLLEKLGSVTRTNAESKAFVSGSMTTLKLGLKRLDSFDELFL